MKSAFAAAVFAVASFGALAADLPSRGSSSAPAPLLTAGSWTGVYLGAQFGWQQSRDKYTDSAQGVFGTNDSNGAIGGVHAGYNHQTGALVFGVEADIEYTGDTWREVNYPDTINQWGYNARSSVQGSARARAGYVTGNALIYVTGGLAAGGVSRTFYDLSPEFSNRFSALHLGWAGGVGVEYALTSLWSARLEYRYTDFGKTDGYNPSWRTFDRTDLIQHALRVGVSYRFGAPAPVVARF